MKESAKNLNMVLFVFAPHTVSVKKLACTYCTLTALLVLFSSLPFWGLEELDPDSFSIILDHRSLYQGPLAAQVVIGSVRRQLYPPTNLIPDILVVFL